MLFEGPGDMVDIRRYADAVDNGRDCNIRLVKISLPRQASSCEANSSMTAHPREVCRKMLLSVFPSVQNVGNAIHDFDDKTPSLFWCQVFCNELPVNPQTTRCRSIARSFELNHDPGHHYSPLHDRLFTAPHNRGPVQPSNRHQVRPKGCEQCNQPVAIRRHLGGKLTAWQCWA